MTDTADRGRPAAPIAGGPVSSQQARKAMLKYLVVAGFGMMQAMMFALVIYLGPQREVGGITLEVFHWLGFLAATPVVMYAARPFFAGLSQALKQRRLNVDVPIAIAIGIVYMASLHQSIEGSTDVYFDSVTMLVFFLLTARFLEIRAREEAAGGALQLTRRDDPVSDAAGRREQRTIRVFVLSVLVLTLGTALFWLLFDPERALTAALAVLVVSCPCAFALASPVAVTRGLTELREQGVRVRGADTLERMARYGSAAVTWGRAADDDRAETEIVLSGPYAQKARVEQLAHQVGLIVRQNQIWAVAYNLVAMPIAATGWVTPWMAAIGMSVSSLAVVLNALRIRYPDEPGTPRTPPEASGVAA